MPGHDRARHCPGVLVTYDCPVTSTPFASRARNAEDVVIWRALRSVEDGRAVEVGDNGDASPVGALADHGWVVASFIVVGAIVRQRLLLRDRDRVLDGLRARGRRSPDHTPPERPSPHPCAARGSLG